MLSCFVGEGGGVRAFRVSAASAASVFEGFGVSGCSGLWGLGLFGCCLEGGARFYDKPLCVLAAQRLGLAYPCRFFREVNQDPRLRQFGVEFKVWWTVQKWAKLFIKAP